MSDSVAPAVSTSAPGPNSFVTDDGFRIDSNSSSGDDIKQALESSPKPPSKEPEKKGPDPSEAASVLGKKGGEASAAARKIKPIPPRKEAKEGAVEEPESIEAEAEARKLEADEAIRAEASPEKRKELASERIREATRKAAEERRLREEIERQASFYRQQYEAAVAEREALRRADPKPQERPESEREKLPFKPEEFENYEDYLDARDDYNRKRWEASVREEAQLAAIKTQLDDTLGKYFGRMNAAQVDEDSAREIVQSSSMARRPDEQLTPQHVICDEIIGSERAVELRQHLIDNPDVFQRLVTLPSPLAVQREMAKLEAKLEAQAEAAAAGNSVPAKAISKAHPPARPVAGAPTTADEITGEESYEEYVTKMNARERRGRR